jgi:ribulose 1,5-bisphosphate synthetase/thiazole synthase
VVKSLTSRRPGTSAIRPNWANPEPAGRYNLVVLGAGTAGLISAGGAAGLGARVALVEREFMGGGRGRTGGRMAFT